MSYDFDLFHCEPGADPAEVLAARENSADESLLQVYSSLLAAWERPAARGFESAQRHLSNQLLVSALRAHNPALEVFDSPFRYIELNAPDGGNGIQIGLYEDSASVTVPYWHRGNVAASVFQEIWDYLKILQRDTGYLTHDPQLGRILDLESPHDFAEAVNVYGYTNELMDRTLHNYP